MSRKPRRGRSKYYEQRDDDRSFVEQHYTDEEIDWRLRKRKPALEMHLIEARVQEIMHDFRKAPPEFGVGPAGSGVITEEQQMFNGLALRDQRDNLSAAEFQKAFREAVLYGEAWCRWVIVDEESGQEGGERAGDAELSLGMFDKRLRMEACDNDNIYPDPMDTSADRSRMNYLIHVQRMTIEERDNPVSACAQEEAPAECLPVWFGSGFVLVRHGFCPRPDDSSCDLLQADCEEG